MNPDALLEALRAAVSRAVHATDTESLACEASDVIMYLTDLDTYLSNGGRVPNAWDHCPCCGEVPK